LLKLKEKGEEITQGIVNSESIHSLEAASASRQPDASSERIFPEYRISRLARRGGQRPDGRRRLCRANADGRDAKSDDATPRNRDRSPIRSRIDSAGVVRSDDRSFLSLSLSLSLSLLLFQSAEMSGAARINAAACSSSPKRGFLSAIVASANAR